MRLTTKICRILVPTDFSPAAEAACRLAGRLAMRAEASLMIFHALSGVEMVKQLGSALERTQVEVLTDVRDRLRKWFETVVPEEIRRFLAVEFSVKVGEPLPGIAWAAKRSKADLILMATQGRTGLAHLLMGSVTEAVLRSVPVPVLALRPGQGEQPLPAVQRILWATDFSPVSEGAWPYVLALADLFAAEVVLLHVVRPSELAGVASAPVPPPAAWVDHYLEPLDRELERRQHEIEALGLRARRKVLVGAPSEVIVAEARTGEADLIVMGTRGRSGLTHVLIGSVAEATIRKAPCPVLAVKVRQEGELRGQEASGAPAQAGVPGEK